MTIITFNVFQTKKSCFDVYVNVVKYACPLKKGMRKGNALAQNFCVIFESTNENGDISSPTGLRPIQITVIQGTSFKINYCLDLSLVWQRQR